MLGAILIAGLAAVPLVPIVSLLTLQLIFDTSPFGTLGTAILIVLAALPLIPPILLFTLRLVLRLVGRSLKSSTAHRRETIYAQFRRDELLYAQSPPDADEEWEKVEGNNGIRSIQPSEWSGIVGFFHPFCNAGGGGERVLWAAIAATQRKYPRAICAIYTGDHEIERTAIVKKIKKQFEISLHEPSLHFVYLSQREYVLASTYPNFTLIGQSLGSLILVLEAFTLLVPDIFIDTMGYAFAIGLCHYLFPSVPTAAYVHYPTISTDMLGSLDDKTGTKGIHSGRGAGWKGKAKKLYWKLFAWAYGWVGRHIDVVMCNSSWTNGHITQIWKRNGKLSPATVVYPPCPVNQITRKIEVSDEAEKKRENIFLYIAQYRPEKNHLLILKAFAKYCHSLPETNNPPRLVLIGSVRANTPDEKYIYRLRLEARDLKIHHNTTFLTDAPFETIMIYLSKANVGVNGMYSEHFGIGNVEGQAAGLILVCHNSGGPKLDICVPLPDNDADDGGGGGGPTGFLAENEDEYADAFRAVTKMDVDDRVAYRTRARKSAHRFSEELFTEKWIVRMDELVDLQRKLTKKGGAS